MMEVLMVIKWDLMHKQNISAPIELWIEFELSFKCHYIDFAV